MNMPTPKFNWEINFGHVLTIVSLLIAGFLAYLSIELRVAEIDRRTFDYGQIRDQVKQDGYSIQAIAKLVDAGAASNRAIMEQLAKIQQSVTTIDATLAEQERQRRRLPQP